MKSSCPRPTVRTARGNFGNVCLYSHILARERGQRKPPGGLFFLVHRPKRLAETLALCLEQGLTPRFLRMVQPFAEKEANHFLLAAQKGGRKDLLVLPPLIIYGANGDYAAEAATILQQPLAEKEEEWV